MSEQTVHNVIVDAGHGGPDSGAVHSERGTAEKDIALKRAIRLHDLLSRHNEFNPILSRKDDTFLTLSERAALANRHDAQLLSIHCNAGGGVGFECFTSPGQTESDRWATCCLQEYQKQFPAFRMRADLRDGDPDKEARFAVLTKTKREAILFELGFIDTDKGEEFLKDPINAEKQVWALYLGTCRFYGVKPLLLNSTVNQPKPDDQVSENTLVSGLNGETLFLAVALAENHVAKLQEFETTELMELEAFLKSHTEDFAQGFAGVVSYLIGIECKHRQFAAASDEPLDRAVAFDAEMSGTASKEGGKAGDA